MRRGISIALLIDTAWLIATGIWQLFPPFNKGIANQFDPSHIVPVIVFLILLPIHLWLNRKPIIKYFKGLGWKWALIAIWIAAILWVVVGLPIVLRGR